MGIIDRTLDNLESQKKKAEVRKISSAQQENERQSSIRKQVREERVRRAQVVSAAEVAGVSGSSAETSTIGSGQTLVAQGTAFAEGFTLSNQRLTTLSQEVVDLDASIAADRARSTSRTQAFTSAVGLGVSAYSAGIL